MELYQLRTFVTVADTGNLTQASERLFTSQPAVSSHIKALEEELEIKLFNRSSKGMRLTEHGATLQKKAQQVLNAGNELKLKAKTLQGILTGQAKVGMNADSSYLLLAKWHHALMSHYPELRIQLTQGSSSELIKNVGNGRLDVTFFSGDNIYEEVDYIELYTTQAVIVASSKWKDTLVSATVEELAELPWIHPEPLCIYHKLLRQVFAKTKEPVAVTMSDSEESTNALIRAGVGLAFIRDDEASKMLKNGEICVWEKESFSLPLRLAYSKSRAEDPVVKALLDIIVGIFSEHRTLSKSE